MKPRIYKKLCKKASLFLGDAINVDEGICYIIMGGYCEGDFGSEDCWPWLVGAFNDDVNTVYDEDSVCGVSWVRKSQRVKATPSNVFSWAMARNLK